MKSLLFTILVLLSLQVTANKTNVYLFHAQGSDYRIFSKLKLKKNCMIPYSLSIRKWKEK